jgi:hypothetical protein
MPAATPTALSTTPSASAFPAPGNPRHLAAGSAPFALAALFGAPPLIAGEDRAAYDQLIGRVAAAVKPADVLEEIWVRDVADLAWEALRLRRLKASLMTATEHEGLARVLTPLLDAAEAGVLAEQWAAREESAVARVETLLTGAGITTDAVAAQTLAARIGDIERIDRMSMLAEGRRAAALREIDRHRASLAAALRSALGDAEDAAFVDVPPANGGRRARGGPNGRA